MAEVYDHTADQLRVELEPGVGRVVRFAFTDGRATALVLGDWEYRRR